MKNPKFWWALIVFLIAWSIWNVYPPTGRDLVQIFKEQADPSKVDTNLTAIVTMAQELQKQNPDPQRAFGNLMQAIGTNDITKYFPYVDLRAEKNPTYALLNRVQKKAAGKIKLGLDLQGGTQFLVSLDTNKMVRVDTNG